MPVTTFSIENQAFVDLKTNAVITCKVYNTFFELGLVNKVYCSFSDSHHSNMHFVIAKG